MIQGHTQMSVPEQSLDRPAKTIERQAQLQVCGYLHSLYEHWYSLIKKEIPNISGVRLELGSGGGFMKKTIPNIVTSDVLLIPGVDHQIDARWLPFKNLSLAAIAGTNVLHHIPDIWKFFKEADRILRPRGRLIFIEPWPTFFSIPIYRHLHHEPFDMKGDWGIPAGGPLTNANGALPWIVFFRDRQKFEKIYPRLKLVKAEPFMPFSYLVSGGIERRWPLPRWVFSLVRFLERPLNLLGLFALIVVEKTEAKDNGKPDS